MQMPFSYSSLLPNTHDLSHPNKELISGPVSSNLFSSFDQDPKGDNAVPSSHLILKHPLEEPQVVVLCHFLICLFQGQAFFFVQISTFHFFPLNLSPKKFLLLFL